MLNRLGRIARRIVDIPTRKQLLQRLAALAQQAANQGTAAPQPSNHSKLDFRATYAAHVDHVKASATSPDAAMREAIGGEFEAFGAMQRDLLISCGLRPDGYVIDVGCGSGRLAKPLSAYLTGRYLGIDVVQDLLDYASRLVNRPDWHFAPAPGLTIPSPDSAADIVCFFSVFTHLLHEQSYSYLRDAVRALKPDGKIVFSFLEFHIPSHWTVFEHNLTNIGTNCHLNQFMSRDGIQAWASHLGLKVLALHDGDKPHIPLRSPITMADGRVVRDLGNFGQSVCVLSRRQD